LTLYEDFVQEHLIVSPNKNGEVLTAGGSDVIRQEEQGSTIAISYLNLIPQLQIQLELPVDWPIGKSMVQSQHRHGT